MDSPVFSDSEPPQMFGLGKVSIAVLMLLIVSAHARSVVLGSDEELSIVHAHDGIASTKLRLALELLDAAILQVPGCSELHALRGKAHAELGNGDLAIADLRKAIELGGDELEIRQQLANFLYRFGQHQQCIDELNFVIERQPTVAKNYVERGLVHFMIGNCGHAFDDANCAINLGERSARAFSLRAGCYNHFESYSCAQRDFTEALSIDPKSPGLYLARATSFFSSGDYVRASEDCKSAADLDSDRVEAYAFLALCKCRMGDFDGALAEIDKACQGAPERGDILGHKAKILLSQNRREEAVKSINEALQLAPTDESLKEIQEQIRAKN